MGSFRFLYHLITTFIDQKPHHYKFHLTKTWVLRGCSKKNLLFEQSVKSNYLFLKVVLLELLRVRGKKLTLGIQLTGDASPLCSPMTWKDSSPPGSTFSFWTCTFDREKWEQHSSIDRDNPGVTGDPSGGWWSLPVGTVPYRIAGNGVYQQPQPAVSWALCSSPCQHWDSSQVTLPISASRALKSSVKMNYVYHKIENVNSDLHFKTLLLLLFAHSCHRITE